MLFYAIWECVMTVGSIPRSGKAKYGVKFKDSTPFDPNSDRKSETKVRGSCGAGAQGCDCKRDGCGFDFHSEE